MDKNNKIKFLIISKNHQNKKIEHSLITRLIKRAFEKFEESEKKEKNLEIFVDLDTSNVEEKVFEEFGFSLFEDK